MFAWIDRNGQSHDFVATNTSHVCDLKLPEAKRDFMIVTDLRKLPIMGYKYGPLVHSSESGNITIGPLVCEPENIAEESLIKELSQNFTKKLVEFHLDFATEISTLRKDMSKASNARNSLKNDLTQKFTAEISSATNSLKGDLTQKMSAEISTLRKDMSKASKARNSLKYDLTKQFTAEISTLKQEISSATNSLKGDLTQKVTAEISTLRKEMPKVPPRIYTLEACLNGAGNYRLILGRCYFFQQTYMTHTEAAQNCKHRKGVLFEPRTKSENDLIHHAAEEMLSLTWFEGYGDRIHIGINDLKEEGEFVYESSGLPISFENWSFWDGSGDWSFWEGSGGREENCVMMRKDYSVWYDVPCDYLGKSVCHVPML